MRILRPMTRHVLAGVALVCLVAGLLIVGSPGIGDAGRPDPQVVGAPRSGVFLVAGPRMPDPRFAQTVILIVEHGPDGSAGLIVNRPSEWTASELLPVLGDQASQHPLWFGGPVAPYAASFLVQSPEPLPGTVTVLDGLRYGADIETLKALLGADYGPDRLHIFLGYAGWGPGQLDGEILSGDWILVPASVAEVMRPEGLWERLIHRGRPGGVLVQRAAPAMPRRPIVSF